MYKTSHIICTIHLVICSLLTNLIPVHAIHAQPAWLPNELKISFTYEGDIYSIGVDGRDPISLIKSSATEIHKSFSPDGAKIAFDSDRSGTMQIFTRDMGGSNVQQLTFEGSRNLVPVWSGDSKKIAFNSTRDGNWEIYTMDIDGTNQVNLSNNPGMDLVRSWSWDGRKILFDSDRAGSRDIYIMEKDGSNVRLLIEWPSDERIAMAAPDDRIAFSSKKNGNEDIFIMDEDGQQVKMLIQTEGNEFYPVFSSVNTNLIAFISDRDGEREVYLFDTLKNEIVQLTEDGKSKRN